MYTDPVVNVLPQEVARGLPVLSRLESLLKVKEQDLASYLTRVKLDDRIDSTSAFVHSHFVGLDGNNRPKIKDLAVKISKRISDYAISRTEMNQAAKHFSKTGSAEKFSELEKKAKHLFSELSTSGEGGELLLYMLIESILKAPQILCKMPLKTNPQLHYNGCDGIHGKATSDGKLLLYWGESKLHKSLSKALNEALTSISYFLLSDGGSTARAERDLALVRDYIDLSDPNLEKALCEYLTSDNPLSKKVEFHGACLVGFNSTHYTKNKKHLTEARLSENIHSELSAWKQRASTKIGKLKLSLFTLHIFFVPFPNVASFRKSVLKEIGIA
jgi:hypothetical protein